jgi:Fe-S cluster assembly protein SufD
MAAGGRGMTAMENAIKHYVDLAEQKFRARNATEPEWLTRRRGAALELVSNSSFPTRKQEAWRYTSLQSLLAAPFTVANDPAHLESEALDVRALHLIDEAAARLVFVDGRFNEALSEASKLPEGIKVTTLKTALASDPETVARYLGSIEKDSDELFSALNTALIEDGVWVEIADDANLEHPIEILYLSRGGDSTTPLVISPRNLLVVGERATASIVEHFAGSGDSRNFCNHVTEIHLSRAAELSHYRLQAEDPDAHHKSLLAVEQHEASTYRGVTASMGGRWARTDYRIRFQGEAASCRLSGLYLAGDQQLNDIHLDVQHLVPGCASQEHFKGILLGEGRAVFDGRVLVAADAQKTDAHLKNDNLILSRNAEIDTKPQLEIYADDVQCSHGTTVGQIEEEQLFYLKSRGLGEALARQLLCIGFALEVVEDCPAAFAEAVTTTIQAGIERAPHE